MHMETPFKDIVGPKGVPTAPSHGTGKEPFNGGLPARSGGLLPEVMRETGMEYSAPKPADVNSTPSDM